MGKRMKALMPVPRGSINDLAVFKSRAQRARKVIEAA
jgi:hypothetical protein